jgi:hypothetical protein
MISTRRIVAAVGLAAGITGLAAPLAGAAEADAQNVGKPNPISTLDSLTASDIPEQHKHRIPRVSQQLTQLNRLNDLNQLHQATDLAAPVTGLLPAIGA